MKRIAVGLERVLADVNTKMLRCFNERFSNSLDREALEGTTLSQLFPELEQSITALAAEPGFYSDLAVIDDAPQVLEQLRHHFELFITSSARELPMSLVDKYRWIQRHFPFINPANIVFCDNKSIINADYLISDDIRHFQGFEGQGMLFSAPHNRDDSGYPRMENWRQVAAFLLC